MRFEPISYLLGLLTSTIIAVATWRLRLRLAGLQESAEMQIEGTRRFIGRTADLRYHRDLTHYLQRQHLAGDWVSLSDILLEPRLIMAPAPLTGPQDEEAESGSVFDVVPRFHDLPQSYAPYNIETLSLDDLGAGDRQVAILGTCGIGKSTALATLALMALSEVEFETLEDLTQQAIDEQEKNLTREEREQRAREREQIQARALERLHDVHEKQRQQLTEESTAEKQPPLEIKKLLPVFVHLNEVDLNVSSYGKPGALDPAEPLVRAVQRQVSAVTARVVGGVIYAALESGRALVLVDGYDELSVAARQVYYPWLKQLLETYKQNLIVIAGPTEGYEPLIALGFTPAFLRSWRDEDYDILARRWGAVWTTRAKGRKSATPDDQTMRRITADNRGRTVLDVTLKIWAGLAGDVREPGRPGWYDALVSRRLSASDVRPLLPAVAAKVLEAGCPVERAALQEAIAKALPDAADNKRTAELLNTLAHDGLLRQHPGDRFSFPHPQIAAYLASDLIVQQGEERAVELALEPAWQNALAFAAAKINMLPVISRKLSTMPDLLYSNLFGLVHWLPDAPLDAPWRGDVFKRLAAAMIAPEQFAAVRARAMAALIASRDKNVLFILRQALRATDPDVRQLACIGIGALGDVESVKDIAPLLNDDERNVQLAAGLALGAVGSERALEIMAEGLLHGTEDLRRAVAEALAAIPGEGHAILRDGIQMEDIMIRRATVYGLSRVKASWALVSLYRAMLEDEQWYVRNAAEEAFMEAQSPENDGPRAHPEADSLVWLIQWAADRGEGVPAGINARQTLVKVLQEGQPVYKVLAALTLGRLGHIDALKPLYGALRDRHPEVRKAAYGALTDIQMRVGEPLPGLV